MSKQLGNRLPPEVVDAFDGRNLANKVGAGYVAATHDEDGQIRFCMLSAGEILVIDERTLRIGLWAGTRSSKNLKRGSPLNVCFVAPSTVLYIRGSARELDGPPSSGRMDGFEMTVESVISDAHAGLPVTHTIGFACEGMDEATLVREWKAKVQFLRGAVQSSPES